MALVLKDRVRETSTTTGTGTLTLAGASAGFQSFSVIGNANTTYYAIVDSANNAWEVGIGTYTASGTLLSRDTVLESSTGGAKINFAAGAKDVFVTYPAETSVTDLGVSRPTIRPSLLLDFANTEALDPRITFARASAATYYGTQTAKAEENLLLQSQSFSTTPWSTLRAVLTGGQTAPNGTSTAWKLQSLGGETDAPVLTQTNNVTSGSVYVISIHAKAGDRNFIRIAESFQTGSAVLSGFNLDTGTVDSSGSGHTNSIVNLGGGFYRCIIVFTVNATRSGAVQIRATESATSNVVADNEGFIEVWGCQLEQRSAVTAYTPTTTQPITNYIPVLQTAASGVARFDHNPTTFESLGLLIEESRTNLRTHSEDYTNAVWTKSGVSIAADTVVAPDGTLTGDKLVENTATSRHFTTTTLTLTANTVFTASVYLKAAGRTTATLGNSTVTNWASGFSVVVNLATGVITSGTGTIQSVGNGWYRVSGTGTFGAVTGNGGMIIDLQTTAGYTGDGFSGIFIWGAQLEVGAFPTSYIPTVASQVTRAADAASMTGANFSSWYNQGEGTLFVDCQSATPSTASQIVAISDGTINNRVIISSGSTSAPLVIAGGATQAAFSITSMVANIFAKTAVGLAVDNIAVSRDAANPSVDTSAILPVVDRMFIGNGATGSGAAINGTIRKLSYYPVRVTNEQLQGLTT